MVSNLLRTRHEWTLTVLSVVLGATVFTQGASAAVASLFTASQRRLLNVATSLMKTALKPAVES